MSFIPAVDKSRKQTRHSIKKEGGVNVTDLNCLSQRVLFYFETCERKWCCWRCRGLTCPGVFLSADMGLVYSEVRTQTVLFCLFSTLFIFNQLILVLLIWCFHRLHFRFVLKFSPQVREWGKLNPERERERWSILSQYSSLTRISQ